MACKFSTLDGKYYFINIDRFKVKWDGKSPSSIQFQAKQFFKQIWQRDIVCEEFPVKPKLRYNYRFDIINLTKKVVVEVHGSDAHIKYNPFWHKTEDDFWDGVERDRIKQLWCEKFGYTLIELYPQNFPIDLEWLKNRYKSVLWPKIL